MLIEHGTLVMAVDGGHMQLYRNAGRGFKCDLELVCERSHKSADTSDLGSDRPGRSFSSSSPRSHTYQESDLHQQSEDRFTEASIGMLEDKARESRKPVILIAPPKALGVARKNYGAALKKQVIAEIDRDYAARPAAEISALLATS